MGGPTKVVDDFVQDVSNTITQVTQPIEKAVTAGVEDTSKNLTTVLQPVEKVVTAVSQDPKALAAIAFAVAAPYAAASLAPYLSGLGAYAGVAAQAITNITIAVAQGVPIEKATENALVNVAVSGATGAVQQQIGKVISSPGVTNAITSTVSSGLSTAARGGSQADVEKAMTAGLAGSTASTIYKEAVDASSDVISKAVGGATAGAVTGGTEGAVVGGLSSAAGALGADLAKPTPKPADTAALPAEQVAATPSGGLTAEDLTKLAEESAKLIGPAEPPTASLDTGVVSDAGTGPSVQVSGIPYLAENAPENIKNLVPPGYRLLSAEESLPENVKATLLSNGEYAFIGQDTSPEYLATQELPTETIPSTGQVAGIDLTVPEIVPTPPEAAAIGIGGPAPDVAPEIAVTAPSATESATVVRVDPSTGNALVMKPSGEVFTITVDPSTKAGSTISVPSSATAPSTAPTSAPAPAPTTVPTTAPDFATAPTTTPTPEVAPTPAPSTDQPILDLIADRPTATDVAAPGEVPATPGKTPITELPVTAPVTTTGPAPVEVDTSIPRVDVSGVGDVPAEPTPVPEAIDVPVVEVTVPEDTDTTLIDAPPISDTDKQILDLISEETALTEDQSDAETERLARKEAELAGAEKGAYLPDSGTDTKTTATTKPDIFTRTYLSPKTKTAASTSALGSALGTTGLTSSRGAGEIEGAGTGKPRKKVWNEESLKLKDALGV